MSSIVIVRQELEGRIKEAAPVAGYSERNFRRYLNDRMVQALPMSSVKNLYMAGLISEATYQAVKQERIAEIAHYKRERPRFPGALQKLLSRL